MEQDIYGFENKYNAATTHNIANTLFLNPAKDMDKMALKLFKQAFAIWDKLLVKANKAAPANIDPGALLEMVTGLLSNMNKIGLVYIKLKRWEDARKLFDGVHPWEGWDVPLPVIWKSMYNSMGIIYTYTHQMYGGYMYK